MAELWKGTDHALAWPTKGTIADLETEESMDRGLKKMSQQHDKREGKVTIAFSINTKKHPKIWAWLQSQPKYGKSKAIREALKAYIEAKGAGKS